MNIKNIGLLIIFYHLTAITFAQHKVTFMVDKIEVATDTLKTLSYQQGLEHIFERKIEAFPKEKKNVRLIPMAASGGNAFIETLHTAYYEHRPLVLSPDMIWLLICQGLAIHINENSKKFQDQLVKHKGKKKITIVRQEFAKGRDNDWSVVFNQFADSIKTNSKGNLYDLVVANFSTTTDVEKTTYQIVLMETFKKYLELSFEGGCGIHSITIEGTPEDWKLLKEKTIALRKYDLAFWVDGLLPILDEFILAAENKPNPVFWSNIYKHSEPPYSAEIISGWIIKFFPYLSDSEFIDGKVLSGLYRANPYIKDEYYFSNISRGDMPPSIVNYAFDWKDLALNKTYAMMVNAGFVGCTQDAASKALRPEIAWLVRDVNDKKTKIAFTKSITKKKNLTPNNFWLPSISDKPIKKPVFLPDSCKTYKESQAKLKDYIRTEVAKKKQTTQDSTQKLQGIVKLSFIITWNGTVVNIVIHQKSSKLAAQKATEIVKNMPRWKPAMDRYTGGIGDDNPNQLYKVNYKQSVTIDFGK